MEDEEQERKAVRKKNNSVRGLDAWLRGGVEGRGRRKQVIQGSLMISGSLYPALDVEQK